jgi:hypothetical protein
VIFWIIGMDFFFGEGADGFAARAPWDMIKGYARGVRTANVSKIFRLISDIGYRKNLMI